MLDSPENPPPPLSGWSLLLTGGITRVRWVMQTSLLKTLACKYRSSVSKMAARYKTTIDTPHGPRTCLQATVERTGRKPLTATFGGIPLTRQPKAVLTDRQPPPGIIRRTELNDPLDKAGAIEVLNVVLTALEASTHSKSRVER